MAQTSRNLGERSAELSLTRHFNFFNNYYEGESLGIEASHVRNHQDLSCL